jgi:hypothetical protein
VGKDAPGSKEDEDMTYRSELKGKLRALYEIRHMIEPQIRLLEQVLGCRHGNGRNCEMCGDWKIL